MRLRRSSERTTPAPEPTTAAWDGLPPSAAAEPVIRAPKAGDLVATATAAPVVARRAA